MRATQCVAGTLVGLLVWNGNFVVGAGEHTMRKLKGQRRVRKLREQSGSSFYAWQLDEINLEDARKKDEDDESSQKHCQKMLEKFGIGATCTPSSVPSTPPSSRPSVSQSPTASSMPSVDPSDRPTVTPTRTPSHSPTSNPSQSPSQSPSQTGFESLLLTRDDGSQWQAETCRAAMPADATHPQTVETQFEYFLQLTADADPWTNLQQVEQALATALAQRVLTCRFDGRSTDAAAAFETYALISLPKDRPKDAAVCPETVTTIEGADCHVIAGGFTPTIFYWDDRRHRRRRLSLEGSFADPIQMEIAQMFGPILQTLLDGDAFRGGDVLQTTYAGILMGGSTSTETTTYNTMPPDGTQPTSGPSLLVDETIAVAVQGDASTNANQGMTPGGNPTGFAIGAIAIAVAIIAFLAVSALLIRRRKKKADHFKDFDEPSPLDLHAAVTLDTDAMPEKYDTRNVLIEDELKGTEAPAAQDWESTPSPSQKSARKPTYEESSVEARRAVAGLNYTVLTDELTFDESMMSSRFDLDTSAGKSDTHDYANCRNETCFKCRSKTLRPPTFVRADSQDMLRAVKNDLGSNKTYHPKYRERYQAADTVNL